MAKYNLLKLYNNRKRIAFDFIYTYLYKSWISKDRHFPSDAFKDSNVVSETCYAFVVDNDKVNIWRDTNEIINYLVELYNWWKHSLSHNLNVDEEVDHNTVQWQETHGKLRELNWDVVETGFWNTFERLFAQHGSYQYMKSQLQQKCIKPAKPKGKGAIKYKIFAKIGVKIINKNGIGIVKINKEN